MRKTLLTATLLEIATFGVKFEWEILQMDFTGTGPDVLKRAEMDQNSFRTAV